ncbi:MAG: response regulator [Maricaulaceae bacterium]|nr:response regulator [Maricaulaceae bacterium]
MRDETETGADAAPADAGAQLARAALDAAGELVLVRAADGRVLHVNAAFLAAFGGARADWTGRWFAIAPAANAAAGSRRYDALMRTRAGPRWIEWEERPMDGGGAVAVGRDVTGRRAADEQRRDAMRARSRFFASVTHELRTPLAGALGVARLLAGTALKSDQREYVRALEASAAHALELVDDILDLSRLEAGKLDFRAEPVDPAALAREAVELLAPRAADKGLEVAVVTTACAPACVQGDAARLRQILFNLIGNAVKFTPAGGVRVEISGSADGDAARLLISVRDTGPGIAPADQAVLFEYFERGAAETTGAEGAGLGLAMVKRLAEAMGGEVGVESRPGEGAHFWAALPLPVLEPAPQERPLTGVRVFAAAPNPVLRAGLADQARALGATADEIASADRLSAARGAVLLVDASWAERAREAGAARALVLAAPQDKDRVKTAPPTGAQGWLVKPVRRASLVRHILGAPGNGDEAAAAPAAGDWPLSGLTVLVAEDDPVNALIAEKTLTRLGAVTARAATGAEALARIEQGGLDAALVDLRMPEMDGLTLARAVRALGPAGAGLPLVALTANATEADRAAALDAGMDAFLAKPVDPEALKDALAALCRGRKRFRLVGG